MADVFVSYARSDRSRVAPLVAAIEAQGWSAWWDPEIAPGQEYDRRINDELEHATAVLVVWSPHSVESRWVRGEARDAAERGTLVPVRLDAARLPLDARAFHTIDLGPAAGSTADPATREVLDAIGAKIAEHDIAEHDIAGHEIAGHDIARHEPAAAPATAPAPIRHPRPAPDRVAICVLPFANMSGDPEQEYFSDGITEDIITDLSKVSALAVMARNTAFVYKGRSVDVARVARELNVSHVLEGSVRKAGGRVRITAQLVDGASNDHVWAERYDRDLKDIFALQDEISHAIVAALQLTLLPEERRAIQLRGTDNPEAYNLYLMARQLYITSHEGDWSRAEKIVRLCTRATELDPGYAQAWTLLALGRMILRYIRGSDFADGLVEAERALALAPDLAEAHAIRARILSEGGHQDAAAPEIGTALRLDPDSYEVNRAAAYLHYRQHHVEEAIGYFEKALSLADTDVNSASMLMSCYHTVGAQDEARRIAHVAIERAGRTLAQDPTNAAAMGFTGAALATLGDAQGAKEWMRRAMLSDPENIKNAYNFACFLAVPLNELEESLDVLEGVFKRMTRGLLNHIGADPDLDPLRGHPRFQAMLAGAEAALGARERAAPRAREG